MSLALALPTIRTVITVSAHPDDVEVGAGGLLLSLAQANPGLRVHDLVLTGSPKRQGEARAAAAAFLPGASLTLAYRHLPEGRLPAHWDEVKDHLHTAAGVVQPDLVLAPWSHDAHQDHRLLGELVPTVFRHAIVLSYEIAKWDGDLGRPNVFLPLTAELAHRKVELLNTHFPSQRRLDWWDDEVFLGLARLRGVECHARYAEAFHSTKLTLAVG